ncbi:hypothetical protein F2P56_024273 [Juglans regia]|uniref:Uncharacterized protein LOC108980764 n=2 Tax=Juglans regia TaxID=51240 RepID=A0A2I4DJI7_JUGRE|nr:uncharacterized protein LOC108980764 [Juglans regia]KAF5454623.1 hypothetical protein F2P56_024273 [Juglans regia]
MGQCISGQAGKQRSSDQFGGGGEEDHTEKLQAGCLATVKEKRSRLYIARKCAAMLLCWHKYVTEKRPCSLKVMEIEAAADYAMLNKNHADQPRISLHNQLVGIQIDSLKFHKNIFQDFHNNKLELGGS